MKSIVAAAAFVALASIGFAPAAQAAPGPGVRSGELTAGELRELKQDASALSQVRKAATRDGRLTVQERQQLSALHRELKRSSQVYLNNNKTR